MNQRATETPWYRRKTFLVAAGLLAVGILWLLLPQRTRDIVTVGGPHRWRIESAPLRSEIVWQPAEAVAVVPRESAAADSYIRPHFADQGQTLYFTLRNENDEADIVRSVRRGNKWLPPEPVAELNTKYDEIGPVFSADGKELYLYSDRPGGLGGFDLYRSVWRENKWSPPENLGPAINTPAHEYDPAISPDGLRLFFASNRTAKMQQHLQEPGDPAEKDWSATLRAPLALNHFDLYQSSRETAKKAWPRAEEVADVNLPDANEGSPYVAPSGAFLYFASDRSERKGEEQNYDLYRVRIEGDEFLAVENLGPGVNTSANELDPAFSPEGFRLLFSSNRSSEEQEHAEQPNDLHYGLYSSLAAEVAEETGWEASSIFKIEDFWWWLLTLLLLAALLAALVWYLRQVSLRRAPVPAFFLIALLVHLILGAGLFFVGIGDEFIASVKQKLQEIVAFDNAQSDQREAQPFEKVADLEPMESAQTGEIARQETEIPLPPATDPDFEALPPELAKELPIEEIFVEPEPQQQVTGPQLARRAPTLQRVREQIELVEIEPVEEASQTAPEAQQVTADRQETSPRQQLPQARPMEVAVNTAQPIRDPLAPAEVREAAPESITRSNPLQRVARAVVLEPIPAPSPENVPQEPSAPAEANLAASQGGSELAPQRQTTSAAAPGKTSQPIELREVFARADSAPSQKPAEVVPVQVSSRPLPLALKANRREPIPTASAAELVEGTVTGETPAQSNEIKPVQLAGGVQAERQQTFASQPQKTSVRQASLIGAVPSLKSETNSPAELAMAVPTRKIVGELRRARVEPNLLAESQAIPLSEAASPAGAPKENGKPLSAAVQVAAERVSPQLGQEKPGNEALEELAATLAGGPQKTALTQDALAEGPRFHGVRGALARRETRTPLLKYAEDNVGMRAMLRSRQGDDKKKIAELFGDDNPDETQAAIRLGLKWLADHQFEDGHWGLHNFDVAAKSKQHSGGQGNINSDVAATGLALLPFLGDGQTHQNGEHQKAVAAGIAWLVQNQQSSGELTKGNEGNARMYSHAIATIALCEALGMSQDAALQEPAKKALQFIVEAQHKESGGWRYQPGQHSDTSVVGWQVMALKSGQMAGINPPPETYRLVSKWLDHVEGEGSNQGRYGYQNRNVSPAMTAEALLCREYLGTDKNDPSLLKSVAFLRENLPRQNAETSYYWYYGTQALFHLQGSAWDEWDAALAGLLKSSQRKDGPAAGSWDPKDQWESSGGRLYATSLRLLILEVYSRHLPLYQVLE